VTFKGNMKRHNFKNPFMNFEEEDSTPWADPAIRLAYEAALGRFILAYNQIDFYLEKILRLVLSSANEDLLKDIGGSTFSGKLLSLELLSHTTEGNTLKVLKFKELRNLNTYRNKYAHGHMEQNPFDGSFEILAKKPITNASTEALEKLANDAEELWNI
jgi:hypothetical protein